MNAAPEVDTNHVEMVDAGPDPATTSADELGALKGHSQQPDPDEVVAQGGQADAEVKTASKATIGRHVKHEEGRASAKRRAEHLAKTRKQREKENFGKK